MCLNKKSRAGFTLIEITLVVLLLAILTLVGLPAFREFYERSELKQAASEFLGALRYAQQRSVMERIPIRVVVDLDKNSFWVPVEEPEERRHYQSRRRSRSRRRNTRSTSRSRDRVNEVKEIRGSLPDGFIFEFVYKVAEDDEIRRGEGEFYFYPDGSADAAYFTILRLAKKQADEKRVFLKVVPSTGLIRSMEGTTEEEGSRFYRGDYDEEGQIY